MFNLKRCFKVWEYFAAHYTDLGYFYFQKYTKTILHKEKSITESKLLNIFFSLFEITKRNLLWISVSDLQCFTWVLLSLPFKARWIGFALCSLVITCSHEKTQGITSSDAPLVEHLQSQSITSFHVEKQLIFKHKNQGKRAKVVRKCQKCCLIKSAIK